MSINIIVGLMGSGKSEFIINEYEKNKHNSVLLNFAYDENKSEFHIIHSKNKNLNSYVVKNIHTVTDLINAGVYNYENIFIESLHKISDESELVKILNFLDMLSHTTNVYITLFKNSNNSEYVYFELLEKYNPIFTVLKSSCYICGCNATTSKDIVYENYEYVYNVCERCYDKHINIYDIINMNNDIFKNSPYGVMLDGERI